MRALAGTRSLVKLILRRDRIILAAWLVLLSIVVVGTAKSFAQLYPTAESRQILASTVGNNPSIMAILGPLSASTIGGLTAWRLGVFLSALVGLVSIVTVIRHTRTEEETGRRELLGGTVVGRHAPLLAALIVTLGTNLVSAAPIALGLIALGEPVPGSIALGLSLAATGWTFAALAACLAQLTERAAAARGLGFIVLGGSFLMRFLGDSSGESGRLYFLSWLSPIGWAQHTRPFSGEQWWTFGLSLGTVVVLMAISAKIAARRDIGTGIFPQRLGPATASSRLRSPLALAWRLQTSGLIAWTAAFAGIGIVMGGAATGIGDILNTSDQMKELFARLGSQAALTDVFLSAIMGIAGIVAATYATQSVLKMKAEEQAMRAELVLATSVGRLRWAVSHLIFATIGPALLLTAVGACAGLSYGLSTGEVEREVPRAVAAAIVQMPAVWVMVALATALFGVLPRLSGLSWVALMAFLLLGQLGQILQLSKWMLDLSPFTHVPRILVGEPAAQPIAWLLVIAALLTTTGLFSLTRRDLGRV